MTAAAESAPGLARRMAAFVYEGVLLFGVVFVAGFVYATLTRQSHALRGRWGLLWLLFMVMAAYFVTFWSRGGQTVAMRAWQVRLVTDHGLPVQPLRALMRYLASWVWFLPALATAGTAGLRSTGEVMGLLAVGVIAYALLSFLHPQRQFWHDALCGTRLVSWRAQS